MSATFAPIVTIGFLLYDNIFSLLPIAGACFENAAGWMKKEKMIRIVTLFAALVRYSKESNS